MLFKLSLDILTDRLRSRVLLECFRDDGELRLIWGERTEVEVALSPPSESCAPLVLVRQIRRVSTEKNTDDLCQSIGRMRETWRSFDVTT